MIRYAVLMVMLTTPALGMQGYSDDIKRPLTDKEKAARPDPELIRLYDGLDNGITERCRSLKLNNALCGVRSPR
jgi:hypothetical protein